MELQQYLTHFHTLSATDIQLLLTFLKPKAFKKGENIIQAGQIQRELYFVKKGVQMSYFEAESKTHVIAFTYPPNLCAIPESFSFQTPSRNFLTCLTDSEFEYISFNDLQKIFDQSQQIERLFRRLTEAVLAGIINRHIELHSLSIEERYKLFAKRSAHLFQVVPHKYIASYLSISPTNFSKLYNKIKF
ncbi:MAG: Crp/Fnr family transcriptional regulator [Cyclobacteriaceae bacterium]|jgi:CRP-like cAMP-binding protein|nr:Crp/Fnr family transcriptional regulator [Flammeovirgaceae bacterium]MCZ8023056.1 Crp/Fnr family transcriptional regulator [Cytophagales bacterium]MCZ8326698.1 Crp/Fnr family transcriptional regulator [Cyclobacteriaceae bacterium]